MDKEKTIVCKFGGTSMADEESVKKVEKIVKSDVSRKYIVVSAPGRSEKGEKVTDLLVDCFHEIESDGSCDRSFYESRAEAGRRRKRFAGSKISNGAKSRI